MSRVKSLTNLTTGHPSPSGPKPSIYCSSAGSGNEWKSLDTKGEQGMHRPFLQRLIWRSWEQIRPVHLSVVAADVLWSKHAWGLWGLVIPTCCFFGGLSWAYLGIFIPISERVTTPVSWKTDRLFDSIIFISSCFTGHLPHISRSRRGFLQHLLAWNMPRYANACNMPRLRTCLNAEHQQTSAVGLVGCWGQFVVSTWAMNGQLMDSYIMDA
jgi:hypothetical protein